MRHLSLLAAMLLLAASSLSQNLLKPEWKFRTGDDAAWAKPETDDASWGNALAGKMWEQQGYGSYDGFAWYRQSVSVPASLKAEAQKNGGLILHLGKIDDSDYFYWNGELLGQTGELPPDYRTAYGADRVYEIPFEKVGFGKENLIAVRVYDGGGGGGMYHGNVSLHVPGMQDLLAIELQDIPSNHIFVGDQPVVLALKLANNYGENLSGQLEMTVLSDFGKQITAVKKEADVKKKTSKTFRFELGALPPGFYQASAVFESALDNKQANFAIGVNPEQLVSPLNRPDDFEDYWMRAKRELAAVAPQYKMIRQDSLCTPEKEVFLVEMRSLGNILVRGWYLRPTAPGKYPAMLHVQGYSSDRKASQGYQGNDMAAFVLNIRGHGNSRDHINPGFPGYLLHHIEDEELYIYRGAYMDCIRAVDFLCSRPEVDISRIVVEGGSQGGALSFATAALDNERIKLCAPHVPFLSDFEDYFQVAVWPGNEFRQYVEKHPEVGWERVYRTLSYIDIKNLAPWVKAPVLMSIGLEDPVCPPHINFAAYNQLPAPKKYIAYPRAGHGLPGEHYEALMRWIREGLGL